MTHANINMEGLYKNFTKYRLDFAYGIVDRRHSDNDFVSVTLKFQPYIISDDNKNFRNPKFSLTTIKDNEQYQSFDNHLKLLKMTLSQEILSNRFSFVPAFSFEVLSSDTSEKDINYLEHTISSYNLSVTYDIAAGNSLFFNSGNGYSMSEIKSDTMFFSHGNHIEKSLGVDVE